MKYLISIGANVDARDCCNNTALVNAIQIENEQTRLPVVEILPEPRANPKLLDDSHLGPLFAAVLRMDYRVLMPPLRYGADLNAEFDPNKQESLYDWDESDYGFKRSILNCQGRRPK